MKLFRVLILSFFLVIPRFISNAFEHPVEGRIEEPVRKPEEVKEDLSKLEEERAAKEKELADAQKDRDNLQKKQDLLLKKSENPNILPAQRQSAADLAEQLGGQITEKESVINRVPGELDTLDKEIKKLTNELQIAQSTIQEPPTFEQTLQTEIAGLPAAEKAKAIRAQFNEVQEKYTDYTEQQKMLQDLSDFTTKSDAFLKEEILDSIQARLKTIQDDLALGWKVTNEPKESTNVGKKNNLAEKIPSDQIAILQILVEEVQASIDTLLSQNNLDEALKKLSDLTELYKTIQDRNFVNRADVSLAVRTESQILIADLQSTMNRTVASALTTVVRQLNEIETSEVRDLKKLATSEQALNQLQKQLALLPTDLNKISLQAIDGIEKRIKAIKQDEADKVGLQQRLAAATKDVSVEEADAVNDVINKPEAEAQAEIAKPSFLSKLVTFIKLAPGKIKSAIAIRLDRLAETLAKEFSKVQKTGLMLSGIGEMAQESPKLMTGLTRIIAGLDNNLKFVKEQVVFREYIQNAVKYGGDFLVGISNAANRLASLLSRRVATQLVEIKEIDNLLQWEKINMYKEKVATVEKVIEFLGKDSDEKVKQALDAFKAAATAWYENIKENVVSAAVKFVNWLRGADAYADSSKSFEKVKEEFPENPTPENGKKVVDALKQLQNEFQKIYDEQRKGSGSLYFLINTWKGYTFDEKLSAKEMVRSFIQTYRERAVYLEFLKDAIKQLDKDLNAIQDPTAQAMGKNYVEQLNDIIDSEIINDMTEYAQALNQLSKTIDSMKTALQQKG
jgi:hypothetical protein